MLSKGFTGGSPTLTIRNVRIPLALPDSSPTELEPDAEDLIVADIAIANGHIAALTAPADDGAPGDIDLDGSQCAFPGPRLQRAADAPVP